MARGGCRRHRELAAAILIAATIVPPAAGAQEAVDLRPTLFDDEAAVFDAVAPGTDPGYRPEEVVVEPLPLTARETRLTVAPQAPPEPPPLRRTAQADPYAPLGMKWGGFLLFPALGIGEVWSDNVNNSSNNPESDIGLGLTPDFRLESDWVRHSLVLQAAGDFVLFDDHPEFNDTDFDGSAALRLDVRRDTILEIAAGYGLAQSFGSSSEVPADATSQRLDQTAAVATVLSHRLSRLVGALTGEARWYTYGDVDLPGGGKQVNSDRDYLQPGARLRVGYEASEAVTPFVEVAYEPRLHARRPDRNGLDRDSQGGFMRAGVALAASELWRGEVALRYDYRHYADDSLEPIFAPGLDANVVWRPTLLTTVTFTASTEIDETADAGASGVRNWTGGASIAHALRDNLVVTAGASADFADYQGIDREELTVTADVAVSYLLRRNVELVAGYGFTGFLSNDGGDYSENRLSLGFRVRL